MSDNSVWLTMGGQYRTRLESQRKVNFGTNGLPESNSIADRGLWHFDLRNRQGLRLFTQLSFANEEGRSPAARPFDESKIDFAQLFVELPMHWAGSLFNWRVGRQELPLFNSPLIGIRDGVVLRRAFDAVRVDANLSQSWSMTAVGGVPVFNRDGDFDDESTVGDHFYSLDFGHTHTGGKTNFFVFHRRRDEAVYFQTSGKEHRTMLGVRTAHDNIADWSLVLEGGIQVGKNDDLNVIAWGGLAEIGRETRWLGGSHLEIYLGFASGDDDPNDGELNSFDPLYPNLGILTYAPLYFPTNQLVLGTKMTKQFHKRFSLTGNVVAIGRYSDDDAVYLVPGLPVTGSEAGGQFSSLLLELQSKVHICDYASLISSYVHGIPYGGLTSAGGEEQDYFMTQLTMEF